MLNGIVIKLTMLSKDETAQLVHGVMSNGMRAAEEVGKVDKHAEAHNVRLLCLFLQSVMRCDGVELKDVYYLIQDLGGKFMSVKEARDIWRAYSAS